MKAEEIINKHDKDIKDLQESRDKNKSGQNQGSSNGKYDK